MDLAGNLARQTPSDSDANGGTASDGARTERLRALLTPSSFWSPLYLEQSAWLDHGAFAFWLIEAVRPRSFVELGTHGGYSYFAMCQTVKTLGLPTRCYAVDTWQGDEHAGYYSEDIYRRVNDHNERHYASFSRLVRCTFAEALAHFSDGSVDLLHIDGRHFYEDVKEDYESWLPKLSDRAVVIFHDINVRERGFGVFRLWEELKTKYPSFDFLHGHGLGVLGYGKDLPAGILPLFEAAKDPQALIEVRQAYGRLGAAFKAQFELRHVREDLTGMTQNWRAQKTRAEKLEQYSSQLVAALKAQERRATALDLETKNLANTIHAKELAISRLQMSFSWRITKPMRSASRLIGKTLRGIRRPVHIVGGFLYRITPLPVSVKARMVSALLRLFSPLLRNTGFYTRWFENRRKQAQMLLPGEGVRTPPKEVARAIEIDYSADVPFAYPTADIDAPKLAVFLHLYHENLAPEFQRYLRNIPFPFDLFITTDDLSKAEIITRCFTDWTQGQVEVRVTPNRGRDIAPKLLGFREVYDQYPFVLHLHSKISDHASALANWRGLLLETLIGSPDIVTSVFDAFARRSDIGMIAPQHFEAVRHWINWGGNFKAAEALAQRMGEHALSMDKPADFPSGSMFWARSAALKPLLDLNLTFEDFDEEKAQVDGTIAHAIERLYFYVCERAGFGWMKIAPRALYPRTPSIVTIDTPAALDTFVAEHGLKLTGPDLPPQRAKFPTPVLGPRAVVDRLQYTALGCDMDVDPTAKVCIGIVTYNNTTAQLRRAVNSARHALQRAGLAQAGRISLIDNGAASETLLREAGSGEGDLVRYLPSAGNVGFGAAHNKLMADWFAAGGEFYIAANPDGAFHPDAVINLMQMMRAHRNRALIEALQFPAEHPKAYDPYTFETSWASGACLVIPRALHEQTQGFDETFFMYCEDVDLSWRAKALGFAVRICPRALFLHEVTNREPDQHVLKMIYTSGIILARKWDNARFETMLTGELEDLGGKPPVQQPGPVPADWRRLADFKHHFTFSEMRW